MRNTYLVEGCVPAKGRALDEDGARYVLRLHANQRDVTGRGPSEQKEGKGEGTLE